jgi:hypothetical protein
MEFRESVSPVFSSSHYIPGCNSACVRRPQTDPFVFDGVKMDRRIILEDVEAETYGRAASPKQFLRDFNDAVLPCHGGSLG